MRVVRFIGAAALLLAGCTSTTDAILVDSQLARISALEQEAKAIQQVAEDHARQLADARRAIGELRAEIAALPVSSGAMPHLTGPRGEDFGPFVDWEHFWSTDVKALVRIGVVPYAYESADCTGMPYLMTDGYDMRTLYVIPPSGRIVFAQPRDPKIQIKSSLLAPGACRAESTCCGARFDDTGVSAPTPLTDPRVRLSVSVL